MNTAEQALVVMLSSALAVLLVLAIIAAIYVIKCISSLRRIAAKAEHIADAAEVIAGTIKNSVEPISVLHFVKKIITMTHKDKK